MCTFLCSKQFKLCLFIMSLMLTQLVHHWNDWLLTIEFPLLCYYYCKSAIFFKNWKIFLESVDVWSVRLSLLSSHQVNDFCFLSKFCRLMIRRQPLRKPRRMWRMPRRTTKPPRQRRPNSKLCTMYQTESHILLHMYMTDVCSLFYVGL